MEIKVEQKLLQETVNYLSTQPYGEVAGLIGKLVQCKPVEEKKQEKKIPTKD